MKYLVNQAKPLANKAIVSERVIEAG